MKISLQFLFIIGLATPADSFFSFTNLLYKVHICGIIGCPDPVCDRPPHLPHHCHHDDDHANPSNGGSNNISGSRTDGTDGSNGVGSGSGGQSGNGNSGASGGSSGSSTNGSANGGTSGGGSGGGSGGSGSGGSGSSRSGGNGDSSSSSSGNYNNGANGSNSSGSYYSNSNSGWSSGGSSSSNSNSGSRSWQNSNGNSGTSSWNSDFADYFGSSGGLSDSSYSMYMDGWVQCRLDGGCTNLYSQVCDGDNTSSCSYQMCQDGEEGCVYTCQSSGNCFRICDEDTDGEGCAEKVMNNLDNSFEILQECHQAGGCSGLYGYYCDENGNCAYQLCNDLYAGGCEYMCDIAMDCFQVCSEEEDGIGCAASLHDYYYYNGGTYSSRNGLSHVKEDWTWPTFIALLIAAVAALAMGLGCFASRRGAKNGSHNHPLKGSLGKRMKLFSRMAPKTPTPRDPTQYRRTKDDGTATTP